MSALRQAPTQPAHAAPLGAEPALARALRAGNEHVLEGLFARHHGPMIALIRAFVRQPDHAERVAFEVWSELCDARTGWDGTCSLRVWLLRCAVRRAQASLERPRECDRPPHAGPSTSPGASNRFRDDGEWREPPRRWSAGALASPEARGTLVRAIQDLPPAQQAAVLLRDVEGMALADVAVIVGRAESDVRRLLCAGRSALHGALQNLIAPEPPRVPC